MDDFSLLNWVILPLLIFAIRVVDVSLGTLRIIVLAKGNKLLAPLVGFFEILIWLYAISQVIQNLTNVFYYLAYAGGFATGNFVGILIEEKLAIGTLIIRLFTHIDDNALVESLKANGFRVTTVEGKGSKGPVKIVYSIIRRKDKQQVLEMITKWNPHSFYTVEEVRTPSEEFYFLNNAQRARKYRRLLFLRRRKEK